MDSWEEVAKALKKAPGYHPYSGRYMSGHYCVAIKAGSTMGALQSMVSAMTDLAVARYMSASAFGEIISRLLAEAEVDTLGLSMVVYWPNFEDAPGGDAS